jgi:hypothetical protein
LTEDGWRKRYNLEREMEGIYTYEEKYGIKDAVKNGSYKEMLT